MKIRLFIITLLLGFCTFLQLPVFAEVTIEKEHRVENMGYGVCAWSSIETSGRKLGIDAVKQLAKKRDIESKKTVKKWTTRVFHGQEMIVVIEEELRNNAATIKSMRRQLDDLEVKYESQTEHVYDKDILIKGTKDSEGGVIVGIRNYVFTHSTRKVQDCWRYMAPADNAKRGNHAVLLIHIDNDWVKFIDSNDISAPWIASRKWFDYNWDGSAIILIKPEPIVVPTKKVVDKKEEEVPKKTPKQEEEKPKEKPEQPKQIEKPKRKKIETTDIIIAPSPVQNTSSTSTPSPIPSDKPKDNTDNGMSEQEREEMMKRLTTDPKRKKRNND